MSENWKWKFHLVARWGEVIQRADMKAAREREGHEQMFFCPPRCYANLVGLIVLEKSGTNWSNTGDLYKIIEGDTQVTPSHIYYRSIQKLHMWYPHSVKVNHKYGRVNIRGLTLMLITGGIYCWEKILPVSCHTPPVQSKWLTMSIWQG